jgi:outer membrane protein assembly factor BamA
VYQLGYPKQTTASGFSANVLYESRDNTINATRGMYWNASIRGFPASLGSDDNWQSLWSDLRVYPHVPRDSPNVLALWNYLWFTFGHAPYLDLPAIGWDTFGRGGRGYIQGRIRGGNQIYNEAEYRMRLSRDGLWGAVVFGSLTATTGQEAGAFERVDPTGGVGLRMKFNKRTASNLTVDLAWGQFQPGRLFFGMQEVF